MRLRLLHASSSWLLGRTTRSTRAIAEFGINFSLFPETCPGSLELPVYYAAATAHELFFYDGFVLGLPRRRLVHE